MESKNEEPIVRPAKRSVSLVRVVIIALLIAVAAFVAGIRSTTWIAQLTGTKSGTLDLSSLQALYTTLNSKYEGKLDTQKLIDGAKHGLAEASGDPYTVYFTADEAKSFMNDLEGTFDGIGAELGKKDNNLVVIST
ncbi:hypothetical protein H7Y40_02155, partial [Pedobacter sp.]|nr:hypothetical protein [Candidatus Saccharibacteria bacterium]